jgi:pyruvate ferredoxin oxidoreductase beta subunit
MSFREKTPVEEYLKPQARFRHLFAGNGAAEQIAQIQAIADENIERYGLLRSS